MAARLTIATSEDRGCPCRQSHHMTVPSYCKSNYTTESHILHYTVMLPLEVVGPGGSLSMLLLLCHTGKTSIESVLRGGQCDVSTCLLAVGIIGGGGVMVAVLFVRCWMLNYVII